MRLRVVDEFQNEQDSDPLIVTLSAPPTPTPTMTPVPTVTPTRPGQRDADRRGDGRGDGGCHARRDAPPQPAGATITPRPTTPATPATPAPGGNTLLSLWLPERRPWLPEHRRCTAQVAVHAPRPRR